MDENQNSSFKEAPEMPPSTPETPRDDGSARARLIDAATKLFSEHGLDGTSTRDIAKAADLNISLISYYFGGKEGLYKTVIHEFAVEMKRQSELILANVDLQNLDRESFQKTMRILIEQMIPLKFHSREIHSLLQREMMSGLPHSKEVYENVFAKILDTIVGIYQAGQKKGFVKKELNAYIVFFSMIHATDMYFQMCQCKTAVQKKLLQMPDELKEYSEQLYMIFVEGVLV
ncbi:MAG: TetR/AcrR family transcriptional regulator [Pseudobdellovibrionaceae bacterium]